MAHRPTEMAPGEREHSDPKGHAGPSAATRPAKRVPGNGAVIATPAYFMTAGPFSECPRRGGPIARARDRDRTAETLSDSVHESLIGESRRAQADERRQGARKST